MTGKKIEVQVLLCRKCRQAHGSIRQVRECYGRFVSRAIDFTLVAVEVEDPWPQEGGAE